MTPKSSRKWIRAVILDLDDVLISERQYVESGLEAVAELVSSSVDGDAWTVFLEAWHMFFVDHRRDVF